MFSTIALEFSNLRLKSVMIKCFYARVPRDAKVEIFVMEALDLNFGRGATRIATLRDHLLHRLKVVGEEDVLVLLELFEHSLLLLLDEVWTGLNECDVYVS